MTNDLKQHFRGLAAQLGALRTVFPNTQEGLQALQYFDENLSANEFELALHALCDSLLRAEIPLVDDGVIVEIETLHDSMQLRDSCVAELRQRQRGR